MVKQHPCKQFLLYFLCALDKRVDELMGLDLKHAKTYHLKYKAQVSGRVSRI